MKEARPTEECAFCHHPVHKAFWCHGQDYWVEYDDEGVGHPYYEACLCSWGETNELPWNAA